MKDIRNKDIKVGQLVAYCMYGNNKSSVGLGRVIGFTNTFVVIKEENPFYDKSLKMQDLKKKPDSIVIVEE